VRFLEIGNFLENKLKLQLHPNKVFIKTLYSGVDFLGWVNFSDHRVLRKKTEKRIMRRVENNNSCETVNSYIGLLSHGNTRKLKEKVLGYVSLNFRYNRINYKVTWQKKL